MKSSKGVTKRKNHWRAQAWNGETMLYLGSFLTEEEKEEFCGVPKEQG
jgi:hypothetical protein